MLFRRICAVDLGTDSLKISDKNEKKHLCEKNMLALRNQKNVIAIGRAAYEIYEKAPTNVSIARPMQDGAIADVKNQETVLKQQLKKFAGIFTGYPDLLFAVPLDATELEKIAYFQLLTSKLHAKRIALIENTIADSIGIGLPVLHANGNMLVNIGAATTDISVIAERKVIIGRRIMNGGNQIDMDIVGMVRRKYNLNIGEKTAEFLKNNLAYIGEHTSKKATVFGIHAVTGLPISIEVYSEDINECLGDTLQTIGEAIRGTIERTPPQLVADIQQKGIYLTGGVSQLLGMTDFVTKMTGIHAMCANEPIMSTTRGLVQIINSPELRKLTFSIKDFTGITL